jgi:RNA polymerase sigma-70 factor (ECF subfamily)
MIQREMGEAGLATRHSVRSPRPEGLDEAARLRVLIDEQFDFIWRTLRRLGVPPSDLDDATQQVFVVVSRKLSLIEVDRERPFVFQTALRVASDARRTIRRRREVIDPTLLDGVDSAPGPDDLADRKRARALLDTVLDDMPLDLRAVFVLFEVEELSSIEIGQLLGVPTGTVASRLRRARADFQERVRQLEQFEAKRGDST